MAEHGDWGIVARSILTAHHHQQQKFFMFNEKGVSPRCRRSDSSDGRSWHFFVFVLPSEAIILSDPVELIIAPPHASNCRFDTTLLLIQQHTYLGGSGRK